MSGVPRFTLNRSVLIIRHKQPFLDWLMSADPNPPKNFTLADLEEDGDAFLIPTDPTIANDADAVKWVEKRWAALFEHMLREWLTDERLWPPKRTLKMFRQWFSLEFRSMVWDLADTLLEVEDWDDDNEVCELFH